MRFFAEPALEQNEGLRMTAKMGSGGFVPFGVDYFGGRGGSVGFRFRFGFCFRPGSRGKAAPDFEGDAAGGAAELQNKKDNDRKKQDCCNSQEEKDQDEFAEENED